jgi:hypothetical protein
MSPKTKTSAALPSFCITNKRNITAIQAKAILADSALMVSEADAEKILDFLYFIGELSISRYMKKVDDKG